MAWQNLRQLIKEEYSRFLPNITTILMWTNSSFCHDGRRKRCCWQLLPSVKSSIMSLCTVFKERFNDTSTYRLSIAFCLSTSLTSLFMECLSLPSLLTFPEPAQMVHSVWSLPCPPWHHSFLWDLAMLLFSTSVIAINMLQYSLYNSLSVLSQPEASWTQGPWHTYSSLHPWHPEQCTEKVLGYWLLNNLPTIGWVFSHCGPDLLRVWWLRSWKPLTSPSSANSLTCSLFIL